jgi:NAD(P)-dependent dehydrogenase (short-subunit alcohol dehydrogenase family)
MVPDVRHVIITGGSSGIGAAIADAYARKGANISLIARTEAALVTKIRELETGFGQGGQRFQFQIADVRDAHATSHAVERCVAELGPCDVVVACAGIVDPAPFDKLSAERFDAQIATNLIGAANTIRPVFGAMMERKSGKVLIVGSGAGLIGIFGYSAYCASKAGLTGFAEALRQEGLPHGVQVSICHPPDTETPQLSAERDLRPVEAQAIIGTAPAWSAAAVANAAINGLERNRAAIYPGLPMKFLGHSGFFAPLLRSWFDRKIARTRRPAPEPH